MYLDDDRQGFDVPIGPVQVNSYGSKIIAGSGRGLTGVMDFDRISGRWLRALLTS